MNMKTAPNHGRQIDIRYAGMRDQVHLVAYGQSGRLLGFVHLEGIDTRKPAYEDRAELLALRHLMFVEEEFGSPGAQGRNILVTLSRRRAARLLRIWTSERCWTEADRADKLGRELGVSARLMRPFMTFMMGATIERNNTQLQQPPAKPVVLEHKRCVAKTLPEIPYHAKVIGPIVITRHAMERYAQILEEQNIQPKNIAVSLLRNLSNKNLTAKSVPDHVRRHKRFKYPDAHLPTIYGHKTSEIHFLVVSRPGQAHRTLVTVYRRMTSAQIRKLLRAEMANG